MHILLLKKWGLSLPLLTVPSLEAALPVSWPFLSEFASQEESDLEALFLTVMADMLFPLPTHGNFPLVGDRRQATGTHASHAPFLLP